MGRRVGAWFLRELPWLVLGGTISAVTVLAALGEDASDVYLALAMAGAACPVAVILPSPVRDAGVFLSTGVAASSGALISVHLGLISERPQGTEQGMMSVLLIVLAAAFLATGFGKLRGAAEARGESQALKRELENLSRRQAMLLAMTLATARPSGSIKDYQQCPPRGRRSWHRLTRRVRPDR